MKFRLGFGLPHPWWHFFFTSWGRDVTDDFKRVTRVYYRCNKCRKDYCIEDRQEQFETVYLKSQHVNEKDWK